MTGSVHQLTVNSELDSSITSQAQTPDPPRVLIFEQKRFFPQIIEAVIDRVDTMLAQDVAPSEIVILAPFISDTLRLSFLEQMNRRGLPARTHRPSRPLNQDPVSKGMLTLARLTFPEWGLLPQPFDVTLALQLAITDLDFIRANLLVQAVYQPGRQEHPGGVLLPFDQLADNLRERVTYQFGARYDTLRTWLQTARTEMMIPPVLDHFFSRLFGEVLSQPGFGFHRQVEVGEAAANLIESTRKFRQVVERVSQETNSAGPEELKSPQLDNFNQAYVMMADQGILAAQYLSSWDTSVADAVLLTPVTTFLMSNRPVDYQFWLDVGSNGWWERIAQALTHPYILTIDWEPGRPWTDKEEVTAQRDRLRRLILGLIRRCRKQIIAIHAEISERGDEQRGQLLIILQKLLRELDQKEVTK